MDATVNELPAGPADELHAFLTEWLSEDRIPGVSLAIVDGNDVVYADGHGARDLASNAPATAETLYGMGSCTKSFTALAIMQLAEAGQLDVTDPVTDHVPYLDAVEGDPVTIHQLLTHTSGMPSDGKAIVLISRLMGGDPIEVPLSDHDDFRAYVRGAAPDRVTDEEERFFYYNSGYTILGEIISEVSGQSYTEYVQDHILDPLGMERSTFSEADFTETTDRMTPYTREDGKSVAAEFPFGDFLYGAGGLLSCVSELTAYLQLNMHGGDYDGHSLLDGEHLDRMHQAHATRYQRLDGSTYRYGYGWGVEDFLDDVLVGHSGSVGVSTGYLGFLKDRDLGVAIGCNTTHEYALAEIGKAALAIVEGHDPAERVPLFGLREKLATVTGEYSSYRDLQGATVEQDGGTLQLTMHSDLREQQLPLFPETADPTDYRFYTVTVAGDRTPVTFDVTDGRATDLYIDRWRLRREQ
ncbi:MAG: serine hydrolase [Halobacteriales archaeon]|nr:serine hydrolase [Halobacteriales archaeon]